MDKSFEAPKSEGSSEEEWSDLSQSDYAKVIFSKLYWHPETGEVGCYFALTETVSRNQDDFIGLFKVGYDNLSQCLAWKKLGEFNYEEDSKSNHCCFKSEELPDLNGYYQFLYVTHDQEVCGASMPFEVKMFQNKKLNLEEIVADGIEGDFLMVRSVLEQKNQDLQNFNNYLEEKNKILLKETEYLRWEKNNFLQKLEDTAEQLNSLKSENDGVKEECNKLSSELKFSKAKEAAIACELESAQRYIACELDAAEKEKMKIQSQLNRNALQILEEKKENIKLENSVKDLKCKLNDKIKENIEVKKELKIVRADLMNFQKWLNDKIAVAANLCGEKGFWDKCMEENKAFEFIKEKIDNLESEVHQLTKEKKLLKELSKAKEKSVTEYKSQVDNLNLDLEYAMKLVANSGDKSYKKNKKNILKPVLQVTDVGFVTQQLDDAQCMIKALEDSKQLAMKEMHQLTEKLNETKEELSKTKCENIALRLFLEEETSVKVEEEKKKELSDKEIQAEVPLEEFTLLGLISKLKVIDPSVDVYNVNEKLSKLLIEMDEKIVKVNKLEKDCQAKDNVILTMEKSSQHYQEISLGAEMDASDKRARLEQAAELYKDLYREKEKLAKKLKKLMLLRSRTRKLSASKDCNETSVLPLNILKSPTSSETASNIGESISNNSDSDTGEHVRAQVFYPDLKKDENYSSFSSHIDSFDCEVTEYQNNYGKPEHDDPAFTKKDEKSVLFNLPLSVDKDTHIPCSICGESFLVTPSSNIPMMEHLEKEHNMDMCPICGQLFDKSFPSQYLMFHVNDHFPSI